MKTKEEVVNYIKACVSDLNTAIDQANELNLKVKIRQEFHLMSNANTNPINPTVSADITETIGY